MAITGMTGAVYVGADPVSFSNKPCTGDDESKRYQIDDTTLRYWDLMSPVEVKVDGDVVTEGFKIEHICGCIVFDEELDDDPDVTVSGKALTLVQAGGFFNWSLDGDADDADATTFASGGWKEFVRTLIGWNGTAEAYWGDYRFFESLGKTVILKLYTDAGDAQDCFEGFAIISDEGIESPVEGLVGESIDFTGTGRLYIRMGEDEDAAAQDGGGMGVMGGPDPMGGILLEDDDDEESEVYEEDED